MAKLFIDSAGLNAFLTSPTGPVFRRIGRLAQRIAERAIQLAPPTIQPNIRTEFVPGAQPHHRIVVDDPRAKAIEEGTRPHIIRPRNRAALHFFWDRMGMETVVPARGGFRTHTSGGILFVGKGYVNHPGTQGKHFLSQAAEEVTRGGI